MEIAVVVHNQLCSPSFHSYTSPHDLTYLHQCIALSRAKRKELGITQLAICFQSVLFPQSNETTLTSPRKIRERFIRFPASRCYQSIILPTEQRYFSPKNTHSQSARIFCTISYSAKRNKNAANYPLVNEPSHMGHIRRVSL